MANNPSVDNFMDSEKKESKLRRVIKTVMANNRSLHLESKLVSLITQLMSLSHTTDPVSEFISLIVQIINLVRSVDLDSLPKPESKLMSLTTQTISMFNSMDLDSQPKALKKLISSISKKIFLPNSVSTDSKFGSVLLQIMDDPQSKPDLNFMSLVGQTWSLEPKPEIISLIHQILSLVIPMISNLKKLISLCPQVKVRLEKEKFRVDEEVQLSNIKWDCLPINWKKFKFNGEDASHFLCRGCNGENHEGYNKAPFDIKHPLHRKHSLRLVLLSDEEETRKCYCCDEDLMEVFYYCLACDYAMNIVCVEKPRLLSIDHPKWHEHTLALFPRKAFLTCDLCACADSSCPFYICPPCDFVVHQSCISLPRVIRISRHHHRISFTPSFYQREWSCGVCRKKINNDYGGYSCIKNGCLYAAHSRCATQSNVWDGKELEEQPEEIEEAIEPFVKIISDGIIQHFSHEHHHLRLDENGNRDYDENKLCQACVMPIYNGNFYSCMKCDFILHETCANYPRNIHHPIHPHLLTLVEKYDTVSKDEMTCSACPWYCTTGFFYRCDKEGCHFKLHVQCATISEPLVHGSHVHPLFLTSKPGERRICSVCKDSRLECTNETFNCIEECDFSLCFKCATLPQKVRYTHDKHILTLMIMRKVTCRIGVKFAREK